MMSSLINVWTCPKCSTSNYGSVCGKIGCRTPKPVPGVTAHCKSDRNRFFHTETKTITYTTNVPYPSDKQTKLLINSHQVKPKIVNKAAVAEKPKSIEKITEIEKPKSSPKVNRNGVDHQSFDPIERITRTHCKIGKVKSTTGAKLPKIKVVIKRGRCEYRRLLRAHRNRPFEDEGFPHNRGSIYCENEESNRECDALKWNRIKDISFGTTSADQLCVRDADSRETNFQQGSLGNCWFLAALISLIHTHPNHLEKLIPDSKLKREGVYQVFLFLDGKWQQQVIDDYFPTLHNELAFTKITGRQLYAPLLEKALAKHHLSFRALIRGAAIEGFTTLTGMPCKRISFTSIDRGKLWNELFTALDQNSYLVVASCKTNKDGLQARHAYAVLGIAEGDRKSVILINPWRKNNLTGALSYFNKQFTPGSDDRIRISFEQFFQNFSSIDVCLFNTRWHRKHFEFKLPLKADEKGEENLTVFDLVVPKAQRFEFSTFHKIEREKNIKYAFTYLLVVFKRYRDDSIEHVSTSDRMDNKEINHHSVILKPGKYLLAILSFNLWGETSRCKESPTMRMTINSIKRFSVTALRPNFHLLGDLLIAMALKTERTTYNLYNKYRWSSPAFSVFMVENVNETDYCQLDLEVKNVAASMIIREQTKVTDILPPNSRQIILISANETDKADQSRTLSVLLNARKANAIPASWRDMGRLSCIFAPRRIEKSNLAEVYRALHASWTLTTIPPPSPSRCSIM